MNDENELELDDNEDDLEDKGMGDNYDDENNQVGWNIWKWGGTNETDSRPSKKS